MPNQSNSITIKPVFISYSTTDTATTIQIRDHLEVAGIACWMAPRDIAPGEDYAEQIINAIEGCAVLLLVLSETSNRSQYVIKEVERAIAKRKIVIPFRIHNVTPSRSLEFFISNAQWIDAWQEPLAPHLAGLAHAISQQLGVISLHSPLLQATTPLVTLVPPHNLPHQLTPFVGRTAELAALDALLADAQVRLVTILGPGGMGKTRLSLALAERHLMDVRFADGIYFVALGALSTAEYILPTLAAALALSLISGSEAGTPQQQVLNYLRSKTMLLVFDNFEHLLDGTVLVVQILQAAPRIQIVATSRERLRMAGEHLFPLYGLDIGQPERFTTAVESAAVQLFLQSAQAVQPDLEFSQAELVDVVHICHLVGGMPLAIDLAAGWSEVLSPAEIVAEIQHSLDFLAAEQRGGNADHRSMRAVFDSTWQRLDEAEQMVYSQLAVFRGGFTREAAEGVAGASLRQLSTLTGKSLIQHERHAGRYTLHELLRQFAEEKLVAIPQTWEETHARHCVYYTSFLQQQELRLKGREQRLALTVVEAEIENIRLAWEWAVTHRKIAELARALAGLYVFYMIKAWYKEGVTIFERTAAAVSMTIPAGPQGILFGRVLALQALMLSDVGKEIGQLDIVDPIEQLCKRSLEILNGLGARAETGLALLIQSKAGDLSSAGRIEQWLPIRQQALAVFTEQNDRWGMSRALHDLGFTSFELGQYQEALKYFRQGKDICEEQGDLKNLGDILNMVGEVHKVLGEYEAGRLAAQAALAVRTKAGDKRGIAWSLQLLGEFDWLTNDYATAEVNSQASLALFEEAGLYHTRGAALYNLGNIACSRGEYRQAREYFRIILTPHLAADMKRSHWIVAVALTGLGVVLMKEGRTVQAAALFNHVLHYRAALQETKERAAKLLAEVSPAAREAVQQVDSLADVVVEALKNPDEVSQ